MNNKGQVLVLFILILPIVLLGVACLVDSSYMMYQKNRLDNINADVLNSLKEKDNLTIEEVERLIYLNDAMIVNNDIVIDDTITIDNYIFIDSIFGKLIGIDRYKVSSDVSVRYEKNIS